MAQDNDVRAFVKESLRRYYRYQQYKMKDDPNPGTDLNLAVKIDNNLLYVNGVGGYNGDGVIDSETTRPISAVIADAANVSINDNIVGRGFVWSSEKTSDTINASIKEYSYGKSYIDAITLTVSNLDTNLNNVSTRLNNTNTTLNNVSTRLNNVSTRLNNTNTTLNNVSTRLNNTNTTLNNVSTRLDDASNRLYNTNTRLNDVSNRLYNVSTKLDSFKAGDNISIDNGTITALGYNLNNNGFAIFDGYASGTNSVASGYADTNSMIKASAEGAHAEGYAYSNSSIVASGLGAHAEGVSTTNTFTLASGLGAHAEGISTKATASASHTEGWLTTASAWGSHAEGGLSNAIGNWSHASGYVTTASGTASHASGRYTIADLDSQFVCGKYNTAGNTNALFVVGNGTYSNRKDAFTVKSDTITGVVNGINDVVIGEPIGSMMVWSGSTTSAPSGWLICNGAAIITDSAYTKTIGTFDEYLNLLDVIGTKYIASSGSGTTISTVKGPYKVTSNNGYVRIPNVTVSFPGSASGSTPPVARYIIKYK